MRFCITITSSISNYIIVLLFTTTIKLVQKDEIGNNKNLKYSNTWHTFKLRLQAHSFRAPLLPGTLPPLRRTVRWHDINILN